MTSDEQRVFLALIDITVANASMIADLRRGNTALRHLVQELHHEGFEAKFVGHWIDCDGRGGDLYESRLEEVRRLAKGRDSLHTSDSPSGLNSEAK